jgi:hypothetical protein
LGKRERERKRQEKQAAKRARRHPDSGQRPRMLPTAVEPNGLNHSAPLDVGGLDPDCRWRADGL